MFKKKIISLIIALFMITSMVTIMASEVTTIVDTDFSGYTDTTGSVAPTGLSKSNGDGTNTFIKAGNDATYGTTVVLEKTAVWSPVALAVESLSVVTTKSLIVETAFMVENGAGGPLQIEMKDSSGGKGIPVSFTKDGNIQIDGETVGTYSANVWYDIKAEYIADDSYLLVTIDGGAYNNREFLDTAFYGTAPTAIYTGFRNVADDEAAKAQIGYLKVYQQPCDKIVKFVTDFSDYTDTTGSVAPTGLSLSDGGGANKITAGEDAAYGTTVVLEKDANYSPAALCFETSSDVDTTKSLVVETAFKVVNGEGAPMQIEMRNTKDDRGIPVSFAEDGNIEIDGVPVGTYSENVWYDIKAEYIAGKTYLVVTIDGGEYNNSKFFDTAFYGNVPPNIYVGFRSIATAEEAKAQIGYLKVYQQSGDKSAFYNDINITFDGHQTGALSANAGNGFICEDGKEAYFSVVESDAKHGKSLSVKGTGEWTGASYYSELGAPYSTELISGAHVFEYSVKFLTSATNVFTTFGTNNEVSTEKYSFSTPYIRVGKDNGGLSPVLGKWYNIVTVIGDGKLTQTVYDAENPAAYGVIVDAQDISSYGGINKITIKGCGMVQEPEDAADSLIDDIKLYSAADFELESKTSFASGAKASLAEDIVFTYSAPVASATVEVTCKGEVVSALSYTVTPAGKSIIVEPKTKWNEESAYVVTLNSATDVFGNTASAETVSFESGKSIDITAPVFKNGETVLEGVLENGTITAETNITFNDGENHSVMAMFALYDKTTKRLMLVDYASFTDVTAAPVSLTLNVTDAANSYAKLFIWNGELAPYIDEVSLNLD